MRDTVSEKQIRTHKVTVFCGPFYMDEPMLAEQQEVIYNSCVQTQDMVWKNRWE